MLNKFYIFLSLIIVFIMMLEHLFPSSVLIYLNPLFIITLWLLTSLYLLIKKNGNI